MLHKPANLISYRQPVAASCPHLASPIQASSSSSMSPSMRSVTSSAPSSSSSRKVSSAADILDFDIVFDDHRFVLARLGLFERDEFDRSRSDLGIVFGDGRTRLHARRRGQLKHRAALRTDDRIFVQIKKFRAAIVALTLAAEIGFGHSVIPGKTFAAGRNSGAPVSRAGARVKWEVHDAMPV